MDPWDLIGWFVFYTLLVPVVLMAGALIFLVTAIIWEKFEKWFYRLVKKIKGSS